MRFFFSAVRDHSGNKLAVGDLVYSPRLSAPWSQFNGVVLEVHNKSNHVVVRDLVSGAKVKMCGLHFTKMS